jgi:hypothetical protein
VGREEREPESSELDETAGLRVEGRAVEAGRGVSGALGAPVIGGGRAGTATEFEVRGRLPPLVEVVVVGGRAGAGSPSWQPVRRR